MFALTAVLAAAAPASGQYGSTREAKRAKRLSLDAQSLVPLMAGGGLTLRTESGMRLGVLIGVLPAAYVSVINTTATSLDLYPEETADLIATVLASSLVLGAQVGWTGDDGAGFFVDVGYALVTLGGSSGAQAALTALIDADVPEEAVGGDAEFEIDSTLHMLRLETGWIWRVGERLDLKASLGGAFTTGAATTVTPPATTVRDRVSVFHSKLARDAQFELDSIYTRDVHSPTLGLTLSWRVL